MTSTQQILVTPVIMAGGSGTRLWPLSRAGFPKQFLSFAGSSTLFQEAIERLSSLQGDGIELQAPLVVGNEEHRFLVLDQLREVSIEPQAVLLEPVPRNTAPALTLAALQAVAAGQDPILIVSPADHKVADVLAFNAACRRAAHSAQQGGIVILGIRPSRPETGYGYIQARVSGETVAVERFVEKPNLTAAERYVAAGDYHWNSGIFVLKASTWLAALERFRPDIASATSKAFAASACDGHFVRPEREAFAAVPSESVDYAVLERCAGSDIPLHMVSLEAGWNDLGAWDAVWQVSPKDARGNAVSGDAVLIDTANSLVRATSRLVGVIGLDNVVIVETPDAILAADRSRSQDVKDAIARLQELGRAERELHRKVHRPWGWYDSIDSGPRFQVKRILVKPGASLSLQMHHHRAEHWVVVKGTAEVTCGDKTLILSENESTFIPLGVRHRLSNPGKVALEIIEIQSGHYLAEDDIVRFEDDYGRT